MFKEPEIGQEIIDYLDALFPLDIPIHEDEKHLRHRGGQRSIIDHLKMVRQRQEEAAKGERI